MHAPRPAVGSGGTIKTWDDYVFDLRAESVFVGGVLVPTSQKEFALALMLFENLSHAVSRSDIMAAVWGDVSGVYSRSLDANIARLRTVLKLNPKNGYLLASVYRFGYRLERLDTWEKKPRGVSREGPA